MSSTPEIFSAAIRETAFEPPPPTPMTLIGGSPSTYAWDLVIGRTSWRVGDKNSAKPAGQAWGQCWVRARRPIFRAELAGSQAGLSRFEGSFSSFDPIRARAPAPS